MPLIIETERLLIRTFEPAEEDAFMALFTDERVAEHLPKRNPDQLRTIFRDTLQDDAAGLLFNRWAIINKADQGFAGMGLLRNYRYDQAKIEVGYCLNVPYWGKGLATELTKALVAYAVKHGHGRAIVAITTPGNIPSQKVLQNAGLIRHENMLRDGEELTYFELAD